MTTLTAWKFDNSLAADSAVDALKTLARENAITVHDAAVVYWDDGAKKPRTKQLGDLRGKGALGGAFWGVLFGALFLMPLIGAAVGATVGAIAKGLGEVGVDQSFLDRVREEIVPGTSALFLVSSDADLDRVQPAIQSLRPTLVRTNLDDEQEKRLREVFEGTDETPVASPAD